MLGPNIDYNKFTAVIIFIKLKNNEIKYVYYKKPHFTTDDDIINELEKNSKTILQNFNVNPSNVISIAIVRSAEDFKSVSIQMEETFDPELNLLIDLEDEERG